MLLESERSGDGLIVRLKGAWSIENIAKIEAALAGVSASSERVVVDFRGIDALDLSGAWLLHRWLETFGERVRIDGGRPPHFDFIDAQAADYARQIEEQGQRMITFLLYLNDGYEGGETTFPELGIVHRGVAGDGLYFINAHPDLSPDRRMLHTGSPPTAGEKWVVTQFIVSKALRP